jgi:hypothetical protein
MLNDVHKIALISMLISIPTICVGPIGYDHANIHYGCFIIGPNTPGFIVDVGNI